jgi:hypothetical protein
MRVIWKATEIGNNDRVDKVTIFSDSVSAIKRVQDTEQGPGRATAIICVNLNNKLAAR